MQAVFHAGGNCRIHDLFVSTSDQGAVKGVYLKGLSAKSRLFYREMDCPVRFHREMDCPVQWSLANPSAFGLGKPVQSQPGLCKCRRHKAGHLQVRVAVGKRSTCVSKEAPLNKGPLGLPQAMSRVKLAKFSAKLVANFRRSLEGDFRASFAGENRQNILHQNSTANFTIKLHYEVLGRGGPYIWRGLNLAREVTKKWLFRVKKTLLGLLLGPLCRRLRKSLFTHF